MTLSRSTPPCPDDSAWTLHIEAKVLLNAFNFWRVCVAGSQRTFLAAVSLDHSEAGCSPPGFWHTYQRGRQAYGFIWSRSYTLKPHIKIFRLTHRLAENYNLSVFILTVASLVSQMVKRLPATRETWVRSLGWEDPLEKEMTTHTRTLAWNIPWMEEPCRLQSVISQRVGHDWATSLSLSL